MPPAAATRASPLPATLLSEERREEEEELVLQMQVHRHRREVLTYTSLLSIQVPLFNCKTRPVGKARRVTPWIRAAHGLCPSSLMGWRAMRQELEPTY